MVERYFLIFLFARPELPPRPSELPVLLAPTSLITINVNINDPEGRGEEALHDASSTLYLDDPSTDDATTTSSFVRLEPGKAVVHRGLHPHGVVPIRSGSRHQLVIWIFGPGGYVRCVPADDRDRMSSPAQRWASGSDGGGERDFWDGVEL